jgi:hypothetical protein
VTDLRSRTQWICIVAALLGAVVVLQAAESLRITPMVRDNQVLVTFELTDAYTDAVRDAIASGLRTTFTYELELRTLVPAWVDRTIVTTVVTASDHYDNLTRRHTLSRIIDGQVADVSVTEAESAVKAWLTTWSRLPLCDTSKLDPSRDYYVRISARPRPLGSSLIGWAKSITGQAKFTFIP